MIFSKLFGKQNKTCVSVPPFNGVTDAHSHILPGVDDGVDSLEHSLKILKEYELMGFSKVWLTPHIMEDVPNTTAHIREVFKLLSDVYTGPIELCLGSENMIDNLFIERLEANDLLPVANNNILVETSYFTPPYGLNETFADIMHRGYRPLLAHPERYVYMENSDYDKLHKIGVNMQLNILSLIGFYGKSARLKARHLLKKGYYTTLGSDIHRISQCPHLLDCAHLLKHKDCQSLILSQY